MPTKTSFDCRSRLLLLLLLCLLPAGRAAADDLLDADKGYYQVYLSGQSTIAFSVPCYNDEDEDSWIADGNLKVTWTDDNGDEHTQTVLHWKRNGECKNISTGCYIGFKSDAPGTVKIGNTTIHSWNQDIELWPFTEHYIKADGTWKVPYDLMGHKNRSRTLTFTWSAEKERTAWSWTSTISGLSPKYIAVPPVPEKVTPMTTMATLSSDSLNKLDLRWFIAADNLTAAAYKYIDKDNQLVTVDLPTKYSSGVIQLNADEPHNKFQVVVSYRDANDFDYNDSESDEQDLTMIHCPVDLRATPLNDLKSSVRLNWEIQHPKTSDIINTDFFEVQRSLTGKEEDFEVVGSVPFVLDTLNTSFTFTDTTLVKSMENGQLTNSTELPNLTYRVRRSITSDWGWDGNVGAQSVKCPLSNLHLRRIASYKAEWQDEKNFQAVVTWQYDTSAGSVWDDRAQVILRITKTNSAGAQVEVQDIVLTDADLKACSKEIDLSRTCLKYQIDMIVDPATSPFKALATGAGTLPADRFYHQATGSISQELNTLERQSSVVLTWTVEDGVVDYYQVLRRPAGGSEDDWKIVADMVSNEGYEDTDVLPLEYYEYKVRALTDCEGLKYTETKVEPGSCKHTGRVQGYVRMQDGTGVAGIDVQVLAGNTDVTVTTDEKGYYMADGLPYQGQQSITYTVQPLSSGTNNIQLEVSQYTATFDARHNDREIHEFTITNSYRFSGFVMYDGTSIPVKGAHFQVNGRDVHDATGKAVETSFDGSFSFRVLSGKNTIQAVMDGHTFTEGGYFKSADGYVFTDHVDQIYFYDSTKVKLTGRVVGGDDQGLLPLDHNLSRNNLGDKLTMVLTLEGDNTSWLIYDNQNPGLSVREDSLDNPGGGGHKTKFTVQRKRMEVRPDSVTGEFVLKLPPVRWKVQQIYCDGYPTLFQDGQVSEVIDLTDCLKLQSVTREGKFASVDGDSVFNPVETYNYCYRRIYHTPVQITYRQVGYDGFDYFGDRSYYATNLGGDKAEVPLAWKDSTDQQVHYTFGYPVFSTERKYGIDISVAEYYYYNNDTRTETVDMVRIGGGVVTVQNGMIDGLTGQTVPLDSLGQGRFYLQVGQTPRLLTGKDALRTVTMTLEQDGITYEATPLTGYILNTFPLSTAKDVISVGQPLLFDILRDPPGGGSSATLSKGSTLKYSYDIDMKFEAGFNISFSMGKGVDSYSGTIAGGVGEYGVINSGTNIDIINMDFVFSGAGHKAYSYTMHVDQDISTSSASNMVGADADLYIGVVQNMVVTPMSTIRAIPDDQYRKMLGRDADSLATQSAWTTTQDEYGSLVHIAEGVANGKKFHLVRDESLGYGPQVSSQFVHSQRYIVQELLPQLAREIYALIFTGTKAEAETQANQTGKPVYLSLVKPSDPKFGQPGQYTVIYPNGEPSGTDEVLEKHSIMVKWLEMIKTNEAEKFSAYDLVANYSVDGGSNVTYSESFESEFTKSSYIHYPYAEDDYFGDDNKDDKWKDGVWTAANVLLSEGAVKSLLEFAWGKAGNKVSGHASKPDHADDAGNTNANFTELKFTGFTFGFSLTPILEYSSTGTYGSSGTYSRKESFTLSMAGKSHLDVDVMRVKSQTSDQKSSGAFDVFTNANFVDNSSNLYKHLGGGVDMSKAIYSRSFVYRTRGGATCNPWEDERRTLVYNPGTVLDERTKKIVNPKIKMDKQSISGVAVGDPARFKVYLSNESEEPEAISGSLCMLNLYLDEASNPDGAKIYVDGTPLNSNGIDVYIEPGQLIQKTIEVYAGDEFDYDSLKIALTHPDDWVHVYDEVLFNVHYLHEAGPVNISVPGDKWTMNTDAEYDKRGWFIPITIDGFNKHQHNFDHIEFQYKESRRGDSYWTNLCSFYADSQLMAQATGTRAMIPENGNIHYEFYGEGPVTEMAYDLRAVLYCRNGNSFLTTSSPIISGVKDTRRPQLFGSPEPYDGILSTGKNIVFNFSEDIEYNYLSKITNFEVKGEVNNDNVSEMVSLEFNGKASVESEAERNFSSKDVTIDLLVKPTETGRDMPLFSHGTNGKKLQLWLTSDFKLKAVVDDTTFTSTKSIPKDMFTQVALVMTPPAGSLSGEETSKGSVTLLNGGDVLGTFVLENGYNGTGTLIFGRTNETDRSQSEYYEGRMMEARLWYRALDRGLLSTTYGNRRLSGYEIGLVGYYPMNEGSGDYAIDKTQGANAMLKGATWAMPRGLSLHMDGTAVNLTQDALNRSAEQDYTLMFWFKTNDANGTLISNGRGIKEDAGAENQFFIGFESDTLLWRSNGMRYDLGATYNDGQWHHYAMTVNRSRGVANIYVDQALLASFAPDSIGAISGGYPGLGMTQYDNAAYEHVTCDTLTGHIDELCFFAQALPPTLINTYSAKSPNGDEAGMLTYLSFDRQERQKDNQIELVAYPYSKKIYLDANGNVRYELDPLTQQATSTPMRDYPFEDSIEDILSMIDPTTAAPVVPYEELTNLSFEFVGKDNQLLIGLNDQVSRLNHRNVYVTVRDIEDKNGNAMASPQTACFYVSNSSLKWQNSHLKYPVSYGYGDNVWFDVVNNTATSHTYTIENCPKWLTLNSYSDVISPQSTEVIYGTVNTGLNVGTYDEILYLVDEDGVTEPLYLTVVVTASQPNWAGELSGNILEYTMNLTGKVYLNGEIDIDPRDIVGVFDTNNVCHGSANITYSALTGESDLFMTIYDNKVEGRDLYFKLWQYSTGRELSLAVDGGASIKFKRSSVLGVNTPVRFDGGSVFVQNFDLHEGWNWVSFNVASDKLLDLNTLLSGLPWKANDILTDLNSSLTLIYNGKRWIASAELTDFQIYTSGAYAIKVQNAINFPVAGNVIKDESMRTITLKQGWNGIGYTPIINLSVETALSDYYDKALPGDVIKSQDEFAYFTISGGVGRWRGSLQYLKPGEGYMLLRKDTTQTTFRYPYYEPGSTFIDEWSTTSASVYRAPKRHFSTMNLSAVVQGIETEEGDKLLAYADGEVVGECAVSATAETEAQSAEPLYMNISGDGRRSIWFAIERDGEIIAHTSEVMTFNANDVVGSPDAPTAIQFVHTDNADGQWHTLDGIRLTKKPATKGIYIFNGKKVLIK